MSSILKFMRANASFDPDTLTVLGDVYDRACASLCRCKSDPACDDMANRILIAATKGELDPRQTVADRGARNESALR